MNKRRRFKAKRRRVRERMWHAWTWSGDRDERRRALVWLRAEEGYVWP